MKKFLIITAILFGIMSQAQVYATDSVVDVDSIGFHKRTEIAPELQIKAIFDSYRKYSNCKNLEKFLSLHDDTYRSADGYGKNRLKELAVESWKEYPDVKYTIKVVSVNVDLDNATVITNENLSGITNSAVEYVKGNGYINSESTAIYYLKRFSNEWRITSDFIVNEKTSMRYGVARFIPMNLDAPSLVVPEEEYTAILKLNVPRSYVALVSLNNEPITFPFVKSTEVFRTVKADGIQERILKSNDGLKNENAIASIGIARPNMQDNNLNVNIVGIAFLSSRVNVLTHKSEQSTTEVETKVNAEINKKNESTKK